MLAAAECVTRTAALVHTWHLTGHTASTAVAPTPFAT